MMSRSGRERGAMPAVTVIAIIIVLVLFALALCGAAGEEE